MSIAAGTISDIILPPTTRMASITYPNPSMPLEYLLAFIMKAAPDKNKIMPGIYLGKSLSLVNLLISIDIAEKTIPITAIYSNNAN